MARRSYPGILAIAFLVMAAAVQPARADDFAVPSTPPGITMDPGTPSSATGPSGQIAATKGVFGDAAGMTLYTFAGDTAGRSACDGDCAKAWPPISAPADAQAAGDWTVIQRSDGARQWAYMGKPLYRSAKDVAPGDANGRGADGGQWQAAAPSAQNADSVAPAAITVRAVANGLGDVFVDHRGMTLYTFDGDPADKSACVQDCLQLWAPLKAAGLARASGDWTQIRRDDGTRQWAYKHRPLYAFTGDVKAGDAKGLEADARFHSAAVRRYFVPAEVTLRLNGDTPVLASADGLTLYVRDKFRFSFGSFSANDGPPPSPAVGRSVGTAGCEGDCAETWHPLLAPKDAQSSGYWSIALRSDGARQWAYQGYPVYTNADDKPGDMGGRDMFDLTDGSHALYWRAATP